MNQPVQIVRALNPTEVLVRDRSGKTFSANPLHLKPVETGTPAKPVPVNDDDPEWEQAEGRFEIIEELLDPDQPRSRAWVEAVARKHAKSAATLYRWLQQYEQDGELTNLSRKRRGDAGAK